MTGFPENFTSCSMYHITNHLAKKLYKLFSRSNEKALINQGFGD